MDDGITYPPEMLPKGDDEAEVLFCPHGQCVDRKVPCVNCITISRPSIGQRDYGHRLCFGMRWSSYLRSGVSIRRKGRSFTDR